MKTTEHISTTFAPEVRELHREVERYLAAVEVFRRAGREPRWAPERRAIPGSGTVRVPEPVARCLG